MNKALPHPDCPTWVRDAMDALLAGCLDDDTHERLDAYLQQHPEVAHYLTREQALLDLAIQPRRPDLHDAYWAAQADRIEALAQAQARPATLERAKASPRRSLGIKTAWEAWLPRPLLQGVAAALLIALGVVLGRIDFGSDAPDVPAIANLPLRPASMETRAQHYLGRSKVLLLGLVNADPNVPAGLRMDRKKSVANDLLAEADYLKQNLNNPQQQQLRQLVTDLERILLQIANLEAQQDVPAIELVQSGIERQGIFLKINLEEMRLDSAPEDAPPTGQS